MEVDLSALDLKTRSRVDEIFRSDHDLKVLKALDAQRRTAKRYENGVPWKDDFGPLQFSINQVFDAMWRRYYGPNYTENEDLMRFLGKRNEEINVRARSGKIMVGYTGRSGRCGRVKFGRGTMQFA